jgi:hypothetical protein
MALRGRRIKYFLEVQEVLSFEFHQPVFIKVASAGLNSLRQKRYKILVKNSTKRDKYLSFWLPGMIHPSGSVNFLMR